MKIYKCICGKEYTKPNSFNGHKSHCKEHLAGTGRLHIREQIDKNNRSKISKSMKVYHSKLHAIKQSKIKEWLNTKPKCETCGNVMVKPFGSRRFCNMSCANSGRVLSDETKKKISESVKRNPYGWAAWYKDGTFIHKNKIYRSKREIEIVDYFRDNFPKDGWTFGRIGKYKDQILVPDLYSRKLKIIFEYDGIWHFKDIHNQLERKQFKDKLLVEYAEQIRYRLVRIDENKNLTNLDIVDLIYNRNDNLILVGDRYDYLR